MSRSAAQQLGDTLAWLYGDESAAPPLLCGWCGSENMTRLEHLHCGDCHRDTSLLIAHEMRDRRYPSFGSARK
jgi:hypothetical protein